MLGLFILIPNNLLLYLLLKVLWLILDIISTISFFRGAIYIVQKHTEPFILNVGNDSNNKDMHRDMIMRIDRDYINKNSFKIKAVIRRDRKIRLRKNILN